MTSHPKKVRHKKIQLSKKKAALNYAKGRYRVFPLHSPIIDGCSCPNPDCSSVGKHPRIADWQNKATTDPRQIVRWWDQWPDANIGIATGDDLVVLDIDRDHGGFESLKRLEAQHGPLPVTVTVDTGGGGRHLYMRSTGPIGNSAGRLGDGLDIRGDGGYIVAPRSLHKSGRRYKFVAGRQPGEIEIAVIPNWLTNLLPDPSRRVRNALSKSSVPVGGEIQTGSRNDTLFREACSMRAKGWPEAQILGELVKLNENRCLPPLRFDELQTIAGSAASYPPGNQGGVTYASAQDAVDHFNDRHAVISVDGKFWVLNESKEPDTGYPAITFSRRQDFINLHENQTVSVGKQTLSAPSIWLKNSDRRQYEGITFRPDGEVPDHYNLWRGFAVEPIKGNCDLYLNHIQDNIANGEKKLYQYILSWMANIVQNPTKRPGVAIVLRGGEGVGKGVFATQFGSLFGPHFKEIAHVRHLSGNFNAHLKDALVVYSDEAFWAGDKEAEGVIKAMITERKINIEPKGKDVISVDNHINLIFASNNDWVVPAGPDARRFLVLDVSDKHQKDAPYFSKICDQMDSGGREALLYFLLNHDLSKVELREVPQTEALLDQKIRSLEPKDRFLYDILYQGTNTHRGSWLKKVECATFIDFYRDLSNQTGQRRKATEAELGSFLLRNMPNLQKKRISIKGTDRRPYYYIFPRLQDCREAFAKRLGQNINWPKVGGRVRLKRKKS
jgi:hypothetical protein